MMLRPHCVVLLCCCCYRTLPAADQACHHSKTRQLRRPCEIQTAVTFNHDVAPIIFANCACCHHPGEAAPFSLLTYSDVRRRASQIAEVTNRRFMPPWLPEQGRHDFANARRLSDEQLATIQQLGEIEGRGEGNAADLPAAPTFAKGWQLDEPDLVLQSPAYQLAATGPDQFRNFVIPIDVKTPQWVEVHRAPADEPARDASRAARC